MTDKLYEVEPEAGIEAKYVRASSPEAAMKQFVSNIPDMQAHLRLGNIGVLAEDSDEWVYFREVCAWERM